MKRGREKEEEIGLVSNLGIERRRKERVREIKRELEIKGERENSIEKKKDRSARTEIEEGGPRKEWANESGKVRVRLGKGKKDEQRARIERE